MKGKLEIKDEEKSLERFCVYYILKHCLPILKGNGYTFRGGNSIKIVLPPF